MDIGWSELFLIGIVALIVVGPKDLPRMFAALGRFTAKARGMAREFQRAMDDAARDSGASDVAKDLKAMTSKKGLGIDKLEQAAERFEKWTPSKSSKLASGTAMKPAEPEVPADSAGAKDAAAKEAGEPAPAAAKKPARRPVNKPVKATATAKPAAAAKPATAKSGASDKAAAAKPKAAPKSAAGPKAKSATKAQPAKKADTAPKAKPATKNAPAPRKPRPEASET